MSEALSRVGELALVICLIYGLALLPSFALFEDYDYYTEFKISNTLTQTSALLQKSVTFTTDPYNYSVRMTKNDVEVPISVLNIVNNGSGYMASCDILWNDSTTASTNNTYKLYYSLTDKGRPPKPSWLTVSEGFDGPSLNTTIWRDAGGCTETYAAGTVNIKGGTNMAWNFCIDGHTLTNLTAGTIIAKYEQLADNENAFRIALLNSSTDVTKDFSGSTIDGVYETWGVNQGNTAGSAESLVIGNDDTTTYLTIASRLNSSGTTGWVSTGNDGVYRGLGLLATYKPTGSYFAPVFFAYDNDDDFVVDFVIVTTNDLTINNGTMVSYQGTETETEAGSIVALNYPIVNLVSAILNVSSPLAFTDIYWNFGDSSTGYSTSTNITHNFTSSGYFNVSAVATSGGTNYTMANLNLTVYSLLTKLVITPSSYVPFLATSSTVNLTETRTGGTPYSNTSWTFTLSNGSVETATARNQTYYEKTAQAGIYQVSATACDVPSATCLSNTTSFNAWNVTGGKTLHTPFNSTSDSISSIYENDCLDLTSTTSLTWNYNNSVKTGTTTEYCFNSSNAFWSNSQYAHHRVYANITWESQTYQTNFTVVTAKYNTSQGGVCGLSNAYKLLVGKIYNEDTFAEIAANHTYVGLLTLETGYGHDQEVGSIYTGQTLNTTLCINATPLTPFYLRGLVTYSSSGYVTRTYAWDNASMTLYTTESASNGNLYYFYTTANTTTTATIDITVIQAGDYVDGAIVKAMAYNNNTLTWVTVQSAITNAVGAVTFELENCPTYYKFMVDLDGETIYSGGVECISGTSYTITILSDELEEFEVDEGVTTSCAYSNITNYLICTVSDGTGKVISSNLIVKGWGTMTEYCDTSEESSSTTLICDTSTYDAGLYSYFLEVTTSGYTYSADSGIFQVYEAPTEFYDSNFVFGFLAVAVLAMIPMSGVIKVVAITFMMFVMNVVGLISIPGTVLPYLVGIGLIIIYELAKGGK